MMQREGHGRKKARALMSRAGYKAGGHVKAHSDEKQDEALIKREVKKSALKKLKDGGCADGGMAKPRADRLKRGGKTKGHKSHTTVNVVVGRNHPEPVPVPKPVPVPVPGGAAAGPGPMPPPPGPSPMPPPGGGGPMGLKKGGRARCSKGGALGGIGAGGALGMLPGLLTAALLKKGGRAKADGSRQKASGGGLISKLAPLALMALKDGGKASSSQRDEKGGMPKGHFKKGGRTKGYPIEDGAGGAKGRLEKAKAYGA